MEGEVRNFILVWITVLASLCYCRTIGKFVTYGKARFFAILPIICLFLYLPSTLTSIYLGSTSFFLIAWLANFKLLLFAFGKPPLSCYPLLSISCFIVLSVLPIKIQESPSREKFQKSNLKHFATRIGLLAIFIQIFKYEDYVHPRFKLVLYCCFIYLTLEIFLAILAAVARALTQLELEPQFNKPYMSTSLQDFWGKRWNLMVTSILRPTIYDPIRSFLNPLIGTTWAPLPATMATFLVSGVMHELILYNLGRTKPTYELTWFFMIHGLSVGTEIGLKKALKGKVSSVPHYVSRPFVMLFVFATGLWLFLPPILRCGADMKAKKESAVIAEFVAWFFREYLQI